MRKGDLLHVRAAVSALRYSRAPAIPGYSCGHWLLQEHPFFVGFLHPDNSNNTTQSRWEKWCMLQHAVAQHVQLFLVAMQEQGIAAGGRVPAYSPTPELRSSAAAVGATKRLSDRRARLEELDPLAAMLRESQQVCATWAGARDSCVRLEVQTSCDECRGRSWRSVH